MMGKGESKEDRPEWHFQLFCLTLVRTDSAVRSHGLLFASKRARSDCGVGEEKVSGTFFSSRGLTKVSSRTEPFFDESPENQRGHSSLFKVIKMNVPFDFCPLIFQGGVDELEALLPRRELRSRTNASSSATRRSNAAMRSSRSKHPGQVTTFMATW